MKYDYTVSTAQGVSETFTTLAEAKREAREHMKQNPECDPIIDQFYRDDELTGTYWVLKNNRWEKK